MGRRISDLTSREAVLKAIKEYDLLGKEAFLKKYSFRSATGYLLAVDGRKYDSKAIAGVAYGYQGRNERPLTSSEFSGGITRGAAATQLRTLGFEIVPLAKKTRSPGFS